MMVQGVKVETATPDTLDIDLEIRGIESLITEIDNVTRNVTKTKIGDYVKYNVALDALLDIRTKAASLLN